MTLPRLSLATVLAATTMHAASNPSHVSEAAQRDPRATSVRPAASILSPADALRTGQYQAAIASARTALSEAPQDHAALSILVRALMETSAYSEAEKASREFLARNPKSGDGWNTLGEALVARGQRASAEEAFAKAITLKAAHSLAAEASLGVLLYERGARTEATVRFERLIAAYNAERARSASDLIAVGRACRLVGASNPDAFKDALKAFDEAASQDTTHEARLLTGELFLEKFNGTDARTAFESVLSENPNHPRALLGLARARDFDGERGVPDLVEAALKVAPDFVEARAFRSSLSLSLEDAPSARTEAAAALAVNPASIDALGALAAAEYISRDTPAFTETRTKAQSLFPKSGELLVTVSEAAARNRLYREASQLAAEALTLDAGSWAALASLGQNQLRLGEIDAARKSLERSFALDPYNVWVKNTLDLMDTFTNYSVIDTEGGRFRLFLDRKEAGLLAPAMTALAEEALGKLSIRYGYSPKGAIRIEAYPSHADFSVRTVGLAGLGALGVCFGPVVAIDSPQARERGSFNWGSTLWHELAHVVTLGASSNRVPRWLTEGISVHEERRARPGWGDDLSLEFLMAYQRGELLPLQDLNSGFVRPKRPEQVGLSYYQASLVVEHIENLYGVAGLRKLLQQFGAGATADKAFESALGRSIADVNTEFQAALKARLAGPLKGIRTPKAETQVAGTRVPEPGAAAEGRPALEARLAKDGDDFIAHLLLGRLNHREKRAEEAEKHLSRAAELWPESAGEESPYPALAEIKEARGDVDGAIAALLAFVSRNENHDGARLKLATLLDAKNRPDEALAALESAVFIYPFDPSLQERRAALATRQKRPTVARDARAAIVELDPVDKAEAYFQLALAEAEAGDAKAARRSVLRSLEIAPRFGRAQELLLKLHREAGAR
jgi:tetratricopeptide (TPR) repeat protein